MLRQPIRALLKATLDAVPSPVRRRLPLRMRDQELWRPLTAEERATAGRISTVCMPLGPYRNLTTLTATICASHPEMMVLNHAGPRILHEADVDLLTGGEKVRRRFLAYAVRWSQGGRSGDYGGNIRYSHAFLHPGIDDLYRRWNGEAVIGPRVRSLFWKESMRALNHLHANGRSPREAAAERPWLRFVMPVRRPLDCAASNLATGHVAHLDVPEDAGRLTVARYILSVIRSFAEDSATLPGAFFLFTQDELNAKTLESFCGFLGVNFELAWARDVLDTVNLTPGYAHTPADVHGYRQAVDEMFADMPDLRSRLLALHPRPPADER
jgi:hypothetical protein